MNFYKTLIEHLKCNVVIPGKERGDCVCSRCHCREQYDGINCGNFNCTYMQENVCKRNGVGKR